MPGRRRLAVAAALAYYLLSARAAAEPVSAPESEPSAELAPWRILSESTLTTASGESLELPARVYVLTEGAWQMLDAEVMRLQEAEARLGAENRSLRESLTADGSSGWGTLTAFAAGLAIGIGGAYYALTR